MQANALPGATPPENDGHHIPFGGAQVPSPAGRPGTTHSMVTRYYILARMTKARTTRIPTIRMIRRATIASSHNACGSREPPVLVIPHSREFHRTPSSTYHTISYESLENFKDFRADFKPFSREAGTAPPRLVLSRPKAALNGVKGLSREGPPDEPPGRTFVRSSAYRRRKAGMTRAANCSIWFRKARTEFTPNMIPARWVTPASW